MRMATMWATVALALSHTDPREGVHKKPTTTRSHSHRDQEHRRLATPGCKSSGRRLFGAPIATVECSPPPTTPPPPTPPPPSPPPPSPPPPLTQGWFVAKTNAASCDTVCGAQSLVCSTSGFQDVVTQQDSHSELIAIIDAARGDQEGPSKWDQCSVPVSTSTSPKYVIAGKCFYVTNGNSFVCTGGLVSAFARRICWCHTAM